MEDSPRMDGLTTEQTKGLSTRSRAIVQKIIAQTYDTEQRESRRGYEWVGKEIRKQKSLSRRITLLRFLIKEINVWYDKTFETATECSVCIFYVKMVYFIYSMQFNPEYMVETIDARIIGLEIRYSVFIFILDHCLVPDVKTILEVLIQEQSLRILISHKEYSYITNKNAQTIMKRLEALFGPDKDSAHTVEEYLKEKQAFLLLNDLLN